jgi:ABC-type multidrug transport system fused ATPase/permease subunit
MHVIFNSAFSLLCDLIDGCILLFSLLYSYPLHMISKSHRIGPRADIVSTKNQSAKRPFRDVLLRFASRSDKLLMAFGAFAAIGAGASLPLMTIVFGDLSDSLGRYQFKLISDSELQQVFNEKVLYFVYIGIGIAVCTYAYVGTFTYTAENCTNQLRKSYLESVLRQDITFFDHEGGGSVSTRMITDTQLVQDGTGEKVPMLIMNMSTFVIAFIIAFYHSWQLTIVLICCIPVMIAYMAFFRKYVVLFTRRNLEQYALAGNVAEEALGAVRTLTAFMAQNKLAERYRKYLIGAEKEGIKIQLLYGSIFGFMPFVLYSVYALGFYYGGQLLLDDKITPGDILTCFMAIAIGTFSIAGSSGEIQAIGFAVGAAGALFDTIDRVPSIDPYSKKGLCPEKVEGKIKVENVTFRYPSRPDVVAVKNMNLEIDAGSTVALVGSSGSGKSTLVQLIERFYDPEQGRILLDGTDLKDLNVLWLRQQIGYVTQEPILFKAKIWENVAHGLIGTPLENASKEEQLKVVIQACKDANAHDFITKLPDQYDTAVGERGLLLSGGQVS